MATPFYNQIQSLVAQGTAPLIIGSTTQVANLQSQYAGNLFGGAAGGLPYQTAANTSTFLPVGTANKLLVSTGSAPSWRTLVASDIPDISASYIPQGGTVQNLNYFRPSTIGSLYSSEINNYFWRGDVRFTCTQTGMSSFSAKFLFNGSYDESSPNTVAAGGTGVITIDVTPELGVNGITYPQGVVYLSFYYHNTPLSVSGRVLLSSGTYLTMSAADLSAGGYSVWALSVPGNNYVTKFEITVVAQAATTASISEIEYKMSRPGQMSLPVLSKVGTNSLYEDILFKTSPASTTLTISASSGSVLMTGSTSRLSISGNGTSGSQLQIPASGNSMFSVLSSSGVVYLGANAYYTGGGWAHSAQSGGTDSSLLGFRPGTGAQWWASSNSTGAWNVASSVLLWDSTGSWRGPINAASGAQVNGSAIITAASGTAVTATNLAGGTAGGLPYQTGAGATSILAAGTSGYFLSSGGSGSPSWIAPGSMSVGTATNLNGGTAGALPYQSSSGVSAFLSIGAADTVLTSSGSLPRWSTSLALTGTIQANISGGLIEQKSTFTPTTIGWYRIIQTTTSSSGRIIIRGSYGGTFADVDFLFNVNGYGGAGTITQLLLPEYYAGGALVTQARISSDGAANIYLDIYVASATSAGPLSVYAYGPECFGVVASPVVGAVAGSSSVSTITFQKGLVTTQAVVAASFSGAGTGLTGTASSLSIGGNAATATSLAGGTAGALHYQSGAGASTFLSIGTAGYAVASNGSAPVYDKQKYAASFGDGYATTFSFTHGITRGGTATTDVHVQILRVSDGALATYASSIVSTTSVGVPVVNLTFATAPTTNQYRIVILG